MGSEQIRTPKHGDKILVSVIGFGTQLRQPVYQIVGIFDRFGEAYGEPAILIEAETFNFSATSLIMQRNVLGITWLNEEDYERLVDPTRRIRAEWAKDMDRVRKGGFVTEGGIILPDANLEAVIGPKNLN